MILMIEKEPDIQEKKKLVKKEAKEKKMFH